MPRIGSTLYRKGRVLSLGLVLGWISTTTVIERCVRMRVAYFIGVGIWRLLVDEYLKMFLNDCCYLTDWKSFHLSLFESFFKFVSLAPPED